MKNVRAVAYDPTGEMPDDRACCGSAWSLWGDAAPVDPSPGEPGLSAHIRLHRQS